ncbi:uncharacterized protein LOC128680537 isoform X1 [Plodia interpunctella]|uniref:uncharacterized protein LOC128680537 isoform X1 n=1 Tax=Plodia interpunctella TaxID=58824 RepID=UPI0023688BC4|nr:uncharacterized protein LOC128680537 isoform X1 [Plodia interpunctella]
MYKIIIIIAIISYAFAKPNPETEPTYKIFKKDCTNGIFRPTCLKIGAITLFEKLNSKDELTLIPGVSLIKEKSDSKAELIANELARSLTVDSDERLDKVLLYHVGMFLDTHAVKLRLLDDGAAEEARNVIGEARAKSPLSMGGKKGGMGGLIAMAMMMKVKLNATNINTHEDDVIEDNNSEKLSFLIDDAIDKFFDSHIIKFSALGKNISVPNSVDGFVGRKKRKGGGGGGMGHGGGHDHDDGGKKKMMMMAMMCMKMKLMMMVPAMMGMMGMMSFKGMMFSMMSFMISKMMLLMKILEKKGIGGGSGGGDAGWAAGGGGGGAWMPAGGQDYGGAGGYDANGQWQSRSIIKRKDKHDKLENEPIISYIIPTVTYNNKDINNGKVKSRKKRGIMDVLQNVYLYWINQILGASNRRKSNNQRYRIVNGVKYVYYPNKVVQKAKTNHASSFPLKNIEEFKPIIISDDFNKGETVEGGIESRMNTKKFHKMKDVMNDTFSDNPWE